MAIKSKSKQPLSMTNGLILAAKSGDLNELDRLLEAKGDVHAMNSEGQTALICAAKKGNLECVKSLLKARSSINKKDNSGCTALMWSVGNIHVNCTKLLVAENADVNTEDDNGDTPLGLASWGVVQEAFDISEVLLKARANPCKKNKEGLNALDLALEHKTKLVAIICNLLSYECNPSEPMILDKYLKNNDKDNVMIYHCFSLFSQQQESLREKCKIDKNILLPEVDYRNLLKHLGELSVPNDSKTLLLIDEVLNYIDTSTHHVFPLDLVKMITMYDNPYQRVGLFQGSCFIEAEKKHERPSSICL